MTQRLVSKCVSLQEFPKTRTFKGCNVPNEWKTNKNVALVTKFLLKCSIIVNKITILILKKLKTYVFCADQRHPSGDPQRIEHPKYLFVLWSCKAFIRKSFHRLPSSTAFILPLYSNWESKSNNGSEENHEKIKKMDGSLPSSLDVQAYATREVAATLDSRSWRRPRTCGDAALGLLPRTAARSLPRHHQILLSRRLCYNLQ